MVLLVVALILVSLGLGRYIYFDVKKRLIDRKRAKNTAAYLMDQVQEYPLDHIYTDKLNNKWYTFRNPAHIPALRTITISQQLRQSRMNMTEEKLLEYLKDIDKCVNNSDPGGVLMHTSLIRERMTYALEPQTMMDLATTMFLIEGEEPTTIVEDDIRKKKEILKSDIEACAFFLTAAYNSTQTYGDISQGDTLEFLKDYQAKNESLL